MLQLLQPGAGGDHRAIFMGAKSLQEVYNSLLFSFSFYSSRLWGSQLLGPDFKDNFLIVIILRRLYKFICRNGGLNKDYIIFKQRTPNEYILAMKVDDDAGLM